MSRLSDYVRNDVAPPAPSTFVGLTDTPAAYTGQAGKMPVVNNAEAALEFSAPFQMRRHLLYAASRTVTGTIPVDGTPPLPTEGDLLHETLDFSIPPSSDLFVETSGYWERDAANGSLVVAIFLNGTCIGATLHSVQAYFANATITRAVARNAPETSNVMIRVGSSAGTIYLNRGGTGQYFGGSEQWLTTVCVAPNGSQFPD